MSKFFYWVPRSEYGLISFHFRLKGVLSNRIKFKGHLFSPQSALLMSRWDLSNDSFGFKDAPTDPDSHTDTSIDLLTGPRLMTFPYNG